MKYHIYIDGNLVAEVEGLHFATPLSRQVCDLVPNSIVYLADGETGEVIESSVDLDDYEPADVEPDDIDSDMGFDPYMGCFSDDC